MNHLPKTKLIYLTISHRTTVQLTIGYNTFILFAFTDQFAHNVCLLSPQIFLVNFSFRSTFPPTENEKGSSATTTHIPIITYALGKACHIQSRK